MSESSDRTTRIQQEKENLQRRLYYCQALAERSWADVQMARELVDLADGDTEAQVVQFRRRVYVLFLISYIETLTNIVCDTLHAAHKSPITKISLSIKHQCFVRELRVPNTSGRISIDDQPRDRRTMPIDFFRAQELYFRSFYEFQFDFKTGGGDSEYQRLHEAIRLRHRLVHPSPPNGLHVSDEELAEMHKTYDALTGLFATFNKVSRRPVKLGFVDPPADW